MRQTIAVLVLCVLGVVPGAVAQERTSSPYGPGGPAGPPVARVCAADGVGCIAEARYARDLCRVIERRAANAGLDPHFFARLLWQESRFDPAAISPAGALGVAQFIPATAARRGLADPFNPADAVRASADYLAALARAYGNLGYAAIAYNAGEGRADAFSAGGRFLPAETRAYVRIITGLEAEDWRAGIDPPDMRLSTTESFTEACHALAASRRIRALGPSLSRPAYGVVLASHHDRAQAQAIWARMRRDHPRTLGGVEPVTVHTPRPGIPMRRYTVQIGFATRDAAYRRCGVLRAAGVSCVVLRN